MEENKDIFEIGEEVIIIDKNQNIEIPSIIKNINDHFYIVYFKNKIGGICISKKYLKKYGMDGIDQNVYMEKIKK